LVEVSDSDVLRKTREQRRGSGVVKGVDAGGQRTERHLSISLILAGEERVRRELHLPRGFAFPSQRYLNGPKCCFVGKGTERREEACA
jgi:hypothetical protein